MPKREVTKLVRRREALDVHRALGRYEHAWGGLAQISPEQARQRPQQERQIEGLDSSKHVDIAATRLDLLS
jgi:hypothetical protein